jgi:gamma-glutamyl:cysteine ligase YbdK (ATP-grasp superfamily)
MKRLPIVCDVDGLVPDLAALDALARVQLAARRAGLELRLCNASPELCGLAAFAGLDAALGVEVERQPEEREQRRGVEEERELGDAPA